MTDLQSDGYDGETKGPESGETVEGVGGWIQDGGGPTESRGGRRHPVTTRLVVTKTEVSPSGTTVGGPRSGPWNWTPTPRSDGHLYPVGNGIRGTGGKEGERGGPESCGPVSETTVGPETTLPVPFPRTPSARAPPGPGLTPTVTGHDADGPRSGPHPVVVGTTVGDVSHKAVGVQ